MLIKFLLRLSSFINNYYKNRYIPRKYQKISSLFRQLHILSIQDTAKELLHTNKSLSRFGDGELRWAINAKDVPGFENNSPQLCNELKEVLNSNNNNLIIGLPDGFTYNKFMTNNARLFWQEFIIKYYCKICPLLNINKKYYNTSVSRPYMDYNNREIAIQTFNLWKKLWNNKSLLIIEGKETHLGVGNDLFKNVNSIKRIECPPRNAFESYGTILQTAIKFLNNHKTFLTLIALGPTATILSYVLCCKGFRAIDVGHIDVEYEWFLKGAKEKIDLPHRYVNEVPQGHYSLPVSNETYKKEIISFIKK